MKHRKQSRQGLFVFLIIFAAAVLQSLCSLETFPTTVCAFGAGAAAGFVLAHGKRLIIPAIIGYLSAVAFIGAVLAFEAAALGLWLLLSKAAILFVTLQIGASLANRLKLAKSFATSPLEGTLSALLVAFSLAVVFGGLRLGVHLLFIEGATLSIPFFSANLLGAFTGFATLAPLIFLSEHRDGPLKLHSLRRGLGLSLFLVLFVAVFAGLASEILIPLLPNLYLFIAFFLLAAYHFTYRIIAALTIPFMSAVVFFILDGDPHTYAFAHQVFTLTAFFLVLVTTTLALKFFRDHNERTAEAVMETTQDLDRMLRYIRGFLSLSREILADKQSYRAFATRTYEIVTLLFPNADAAFGYHEREGEISMAFADHYTTKHVPYLYELHAPEDMEREEVLFHSDIHTLLHKLYGPQLSLTETQTFARCYLIFSFTPKHRFIIGLDYFDPEKVTAARGKRMKSFTNLLNKLFWKNHLTTQTMRMKEDIILTLAKSLELYDTYTKRHAEDVARLATKIAEHLEVSKEQLDNLYWAGLLHDIGKLGIPSYILNKSGSLDEEEYETIKRHVTLGADTLEGAEDLSHISAFVRDHHEWWDGSGYPDGKQGEQISLGGRILAVADAIVTMKDYRPYQESLSIERIVSELRAHRGKQFAPDAVDAALALIDQGVLNTLA